MFFHHITQKEDLLRIESLAYRIWPHTFKDILSEAQIAYMLSMMYSQKKLTEQFNLGHYFILAEEDNRDFGFIGFEINNKIGVCKIHKIYVLPQEQGRGIGKKLLEKCLEISLQNNQKKLLLNVNRFNKAISFYEQLGFKITLSEDIDIGHGYLMEDYQMEKEIDNL